MAMNLSNTCAVAVLTLFFGSALLAVGQRASSVPPGPSPTSGACRTYDTSITSVTVGGPVRTTIEWSGVFDPWSLRFVQNVNFSSNQGSHFSYVQVSSWASVAVIERSARSSPFSELRRVTGGCAGSGRSTDYSSRS